MVQTLFGIKIDQSQQFLEDGTRIPVTMVRLVDNTVIGIKSLEKHGYSAVQLGIQSRKKGTKAQKGLGKAAGQEIAPLFVREVRIVEENAELPQLGSKLAASEVFKPGDIVDVIGISKGKGFAGVVKRHHFKGGPRTHGQSDRERAPGSIGQTTTPGRVYKGKRMAGRMGSDQVTVKNLQVVQITDDGVMFIKGLVPGVRKSLIEIVKVGEAKKFTPLYKESEETKEPEEPKASEETELKEEK